MCYCAVVLLLGANVKAFISLNFPHQQQQQEYLQKAIRHSVTLHFVHLASKHALKTDRHK